MEFIEVKSADWRRSGEDAKTILDGVHNFRLGDPQVIIFDGGRRVALGKVYEYHVTENGTVVFFNVVEPNLSDKDLKAVLRVYNLLRGISGGPRPVPNYSDSSGDPDVAGMDGATAMALGYNSDPEEVARRAHRTPPSRARSIADMIGYGED